MWAVYRVYAQILAQVAVPPAAPPPVVDITPTAPQELPEFNQPAKSMPEDDWFKTAKIKIKHSETTYLYFDEYETHGTRVDLQPFLLVWTHPNHPDAEPYVIRAESARIHFEREFRIGGESPGRLLSGSLNGTVKISGPHGLVIDGRDMTFTEEAHHLYSDHAIAFAYQPESESLQRITGRADQLEIDFEAVTYAAWGRDMPQVGAIRTVQLRKNVQIDFRYLDEGLPRNVRVTSTGPFVYDMQKKLATFRDDVRVTRPTHRPEESPRYDRLVCDWLALQFSRRSESRGNPGAAGHAGRGNTSSPSDSMDRPLDEETSLGGLTFHSMRAGSHLRHAVLLQSDQTGLSARMTDLGYDAIRRTAVLFGTHPPQGRTDVIAQIDRAVLSAPTIQINHNEQGELTSAQCVGEGSIDYVHPGNEQDASLRFRGSWKRQLWVEPHPETNQIIAYLDGEATILQPHEQGMTSDHLTLWINADAAHAGVSERAMAASASTPESEQNTVTVPRPQDSRPRQLPLRRALAEGNVAMAGKTWQVETQRLDITFRSGRLRNQTGIGPQQSDAGHPPEMSEHPESRDRESDSWEKSPWIIKADSIQAQMIQDPETEQVDVSEVVAEGNARIEQSRPGTDPSQTLPQLLKITGSRLHMQNKGGIDQTIYLSGNPAHLRRGDPIQGEVHIEGDELLFDRAMNVAKVVGSGMMQVPMSQSIDGSLLDSPVPLDIHWTREMVFDGQVARFIEGVRARLQDSVMSCDEMTVTLNQKIDFSSRRPGTDNLALKTINCLRGVDIQVYRWQQTLTGEQDLVGITEGRVATLEIDIETGDYFALGPGKIHDWQKGQRRRVSVAPETMAAANQPLEPDKNQWEFTHVRFAGRLTGNFQKKRGVLHDRVRILYAPVKEVRTVFLRDELSQESESSRKAVWLGCDELQISLHSHPQRQEDFVQLLALGKTKQVEIEGHLFQASADTMSYDESKNLFTFRGLGSNLASFAYQERQGERYKESSGQVIQVNPSLGAGSIQGSNGAFGTQ